MTARYFIGLQLCQGTSTIYGALVRVWGRGLLAVTDVIASSCCRDNRIRTVWATDHETAEPGVPIHHGSAADLAELAAEAVAPLIHRLTADATSLRTISLLGFGKWYVDSLNHATYVPCCDTAMLAKLTGLTVIDDFPARDLAHGGLGGPCEAAGAWLLLSDRGVLPGRVIRALVDVNETVRLFLLPPRQSVQLPSQLVCFELGPGLSLFNGVIRCLAPGQPPFDVKDNLSVQGRRIPKLVRQWQQHLDRNPTHWTPYGIDPDPFIEALGDWPSPTQTRLPDTLCSAIHLMVEQIGRCVKERLPRALPVGQMILGGPISHHAFLMRQLKQTLPEVHVIPMEDLVATTDEWRASAAALLGMLHIDQVPTNSPALTGADAPRILGRITPGSPGNWHHVLDDMADTLPDKMTLRSAI